MASLDSVIPVFNEPDGVREFHTSLDRPASGLAVARIRFIHVNGGSTGGTQAASAVGLDACGGSGGVAMRDGGGQHPPSPPPGIVRPHAEGYGAVKTRRRGGRAAVEHFTSPTFHWLIRRPGGFDFRAGTARFRPAGASKHKPRKMPLQIGPAFLVLAAAAVMILLGFVGIYVGMIFQEVKRRPVYVVRSTSGALGWKP